MTHTIGTSYFESKRAAIRYFRYEEATSEDIGRKLAEGSIHIGKPELKSDETLSVDSDGRYMITVHTGATGSLVSAVTEGPIKL